MDNNSQICESDYLICAKAVELMEKYGIYNRYEAADKRNELHNLKYGRNEDARP